MHVFRKIYKSFSPRLCNKEVSMEKKYVVLGACLLFLVATFMFVFSAMFSDFTDDFDAASVNTSRWGLAITAGSGMTINQSGGFLIINGTVVGDDGEGSATATLNSTYTVNLTRDINVSVYMNTSSISFNTDNRSYSSFYFYNAETDLNLGCQVKYEEGTGWILRTFNSSEDDEENSGITGGEGVLSGYWNVTTKNLSCGFKGSTVTITEVNVSTYEKITLNLEGEVNYDGSNNNTFNLRFDNLSYLETDVVYPSISFVSFGDYGNYSGTSLLLNVSVTDDSPDVVFFNITNSTGVQNATLAASRQGDSIYWNASLDTTGFSEGHYNITVWANDTDGNLNNSEFANSVIFDNTAPTVSLTSSSSTKTSIVGSISATDALSGVSDSCTVDRSGATISGTGVSQTMTESDLSCGITFTYNVNCRDSAGNIGSSSATSLSTSSCGGSSDPVSGGSSYEMTYVLDEEQFMKGYSQQLKQNERIKFKSGGDYHHVLAKNVDDSKATIEVSSDPITIELDVGEDAKIDLDADDYYDLFVLLNGIEGNKANVTIKGLHEFSEGGDGGVVTTGEVLPEGDVENGGSSDGGRSLWWIYLIVAVAVLVLIAVVFILKRRR